MNRGLKGEWGKENYEERDTGEREKGIHERKLWRDAKGTHDKNRMKTMDPEEKLASQIVSDSVLF